MQIIRGDHAAPLSRAQKNHLRKWIQNLRGGTFDQTTGKLEGMANTYCCLGVACVTAKQNRVKIERAETVFGDIEFDGEACFLPVAVQQWLGVPNRNPKIEFTVGDARKYFSHQKFAMARERAGLPVDADDTEPLTRVNLTDLNDDHGLTFAEIADILEAAFSLTE